ncbi:MAG TPA: OmpA family protein, partial [Cyclobacteriaceae bacterium]|nr:OmpA family protein [Cyclobacteriaceae bacterium]
MKLSWPIRLTGLLFLIFPFIPALAQSVAPAAGSINLASDINQKVVPFPLNKANSNYMETGPLISSNGKRLFYSRYGHPSNTGGAEDIDIWYNEFNDSTQSWSDAINIGSPLNNKGPNFVCEVGWTNDTLMLANRYDKKGRMKAGLSVSVWNGKTWSIPAPIQVKNDYNMAENVGYDLSSYRNVLLISEEKVDSYGKTDLYVAFRDRSSVRTTTESFNLGQVINSTGSERSPFLTDDTKTLYFASDGHNGYGKLDIFRSHRLDDTWTNWSKPENLGPGINTPFDDRNFGFGTTSRYAYYSRGINETRTDIYLVPLSALFVLEKTAVNDLAAKTTATEPGQTFTMQDAFPEEKAELTDLTKAELKQVVAYMQRLKDLVLFLNTHSALHKNRSQSFTLSNQRLEEVKRYLIASGIDKSRIQGESDGHDVTEHGYKEIPL